MSDRARQAPLGFKSAAVFDNLVCAVYFMGYGEAGIIDFPVTEVLAGSIPVCPVRICIMHPTLFRGRKIHANKKYPSVWWPEHSMSWADGCVAIHRIIAYEKYGDLTDMQVHHIDENIWNWAPDNLLLTTHEVHRQLHVGTFPEHRVCGYEQCGKNIVVRSHRKQKRDKSYCSLSCANLVRHAVQWPDAAIVQKMVKSIGYAATGRSIGVSDNGVRKFLHRELA